jgi:sulfane dehydrogenase subunit SoxC
VQRDRSLTLDELQARLHVRIPVTLECAGNGRAKLSPRPVSQPWLLEAVGTAEWGGTPLRPLLEEAGILDGAVDVLFTGLDRGLEAEVEQSFERSLSTADALRDEVLLAWEINGVPLPPQHGFPLRLVVPGWYGMASVTWLDRITVLDRPYDG